MLTLSFSLLAGAYALEIIEVLPDNSVFLATSALSLAMLFIRRLLHLAFFFAGISLMGWAAGAQIAQRLAHELDGSTLFLKVRILDFVEEQNGSLLFVARPLTHTSLPSRIRMSWLSAEAIPTPGEVWRFEARLRRPHGYANPGGFDYERWLFRQRIGATAYVTEGSHSYRLAGERPSRIDRIRVHVVARISKLLPDNDAAAVLMAITVGARHRVERDAWDRYAETGTSHLMAISGLHIGLAAGISYLLIRGLIAPFGRRRQLRDMAVYGAAFTAVVYAAVSGLGIPSQRAVLMTLGGVLTLMLRRQLKPGVLLGIPAVLIFCADPLALLAPGFLLSFAAVGILILPGMAVVTVTAFGARGRLLTPARHLKHLWLMQIALCAGLFPLTVLLFNRFSLVAVPLNLLLVPLFNVLTVPAALLGLLLDGPLAPAGDLLLQLAHRSIGWLLWLLTAAAELSFASYRTTLAVTALIATLPLLHVLLPAGWPGRRLAIVAMTTTLLQKPAPPAADCFVYHALDVGQGQAVVIQTHEDAVLYDTGPAFASGADAGQLVILPFLTAMGIERLDRLIISHADLDHSGGAGSVLASIDTGPVLAGEPLRAHSVKHALCIAGEQWFSAGVRFRVIHPRRDSPWLGNNASCVLEVSAGRHRLLLTGDIEAPVETLLQYYAELREQDVVFVPHHGSRTSSTAALVEATRPDLVIVSAGYRNRWGFPKPAVSERWALAGAALRNTAHSGAISQQICRDSGSNVLTETRLARRKYWHESPQNLP